MAETPIVIDKYDWTVYVNTSHISELAAKNYVAWLKFWDDINGPKTSTSADFEGYVDQVLRSDDVDAAINLLMVWRRENPAVARACDAFFTAKLREHLTTKIHSKRSKR